MPGLTASGQENWLPDGAARNDGAAVGIILPPESDVAVIGAGPAGLMAAEVLAQGGVASPSMTPCRRPAASS